MSDNEDASLVASQLHSSRKAAVNALPVANWEGVPGRGDYIGTGEDQVLRLRKELAGVRITGWRGYG